ncbi:MAG: glycosyltransferase family 1 protein [Phycisphaeraceae bacterium]|nr:glycosyltransferase family 1 protein [Phycisphaeraceae bacterium]
MRLQLIGRGKYGPEGAQLEGFSMYRRALRQRLGLTISRQDALELPDVEQTLRDAAADVAVVMVSWREKAPDLINMFQRVRAARPGLKLVFLDYYAQTSTPHFGVMPYVDVYVKRQLLANPAAYQRDLAGGFIFTDYLVRQRGYEIGSWHFGSRFDPSQRHKLVLGWNLGVQKLYRMLLWWDRWAGLSWRRRPLDVCGRFTPPSAGQNHEWYEQYRKEAEILLRPLADSYQISASERLSKRAYFHELRHSKIVVSPFGWGELCFRDYEAICCGALLLKPSMSHLRTSPDIFSDETCYVPLKWDLSDMGEKCDYYLKHPDEAAAIVDRGRRRLWTYFENGGFVRDVRRMLTPIRAARIQPSIVPAAAAPRAPQPALTP